MKCFAHDPLVSNIVIRSSKIENGYDKLNHFFFVTVGFIGLHCEKLCGVGFYGYNCTKKCNCLNDGHCNPSNGECLCRPGYEGPICENRCKVKSKSFLFTLSVTSG